MTKQKINVKKLLFDLLGNGVGLFSAGIWSFITYHLVRHGGIILYEESRLISIIEVLISIFGVGYFGSKLIGILRNPEKYLKDKRK